MKGRKCQRSLILSSQLAVIHFSHVTFLSRILSLIAACGLRNAGLTQPPVSSLPSCSPSHSEMHLSTYSSPITAFNIWSDPSTALLFDRVISVLFLFVSVFSFQCVLIFMCFKAAKQIMLVFIIFCDTSERVYFALSFVCCLCPLCLCAYHCFFSSDLNKAWPGGNCPYQLIDYWLSWTPPHTRTWNICENAPRVDLYDQTLCPPSQDAWDMIVTPFLYPLCPFRREKKNNPNIQAMRETAQYWECCLIAFRSKKKNSTQNESEHFSAPKPICDHEIVL